MKASELMVGDWVYVKDYPMKPTPTKIKPEHFIRSLVAFDPIPLTPEILEKNGFGFVEPDKYYPVPRYYFAKDGKRDGAIVIISFYDPPVSGVKILTEIDNECSHDCGINSVHNCDIEYVHELQHALRLCGIEKTIEL